MGFYLILLILPRDINMKGRNLINKIGIGAWAMLTMALAYAGAPLWTFAPLTATTVMVPAYDSATVKYQITNQSKRPHTLVMNAIPGITQVTTAGNCPNPFVLGYQQSCILNLTINGSALSRNVMGGPVVCQQGNLNQCYQPSRANSLMITKMPSEAQTVLTTSVSDLALSVTGLTEYGVSGTPSSGLARIITITNTGSNTAVNLSVIPPTWPAGTTSSTTCGSVLAASNSCTITVTPGDTATSDGTNPCSTTGTAPVPGIVQVTADNASTVSSNVVVLSYGCIYQGGYIYAFDDTTVNTGNVGGKVVTTTNQAALFPNGIVWSSNGGTGHGSGGVNPIDVSYDKLPGIDETSTSSTSSPTYSTFATFFSSTYTNSNPFSAASFNACNGRSDGFCNTGNILTFYNQLITHYNSLGTAPFTASSGPTNATYYAAGLCSGTINSYSNWYLSAICELGYDTLNLGTGCGSSGAPTLQNMQSSLVDFNNLNLLAGIYWSSTEVLGDSQFVVWNQFFASGGSSFQANDTKATQLAVRCSRALTF